MKLTEIMSPIIITLMVASGGKVSAGVYRPAVAFLSNGVIEICAKILLPIVGITLIINLISNFSSVIKLNKFSDFTSSIIKWVLGIIITVFSIFMTIQGITSATFDGISIRATKYAISNSIPLVGGFIKDGFDLIVAGNVLIKNTLGIVVVFALVYTILSPVFLILSFSLMLKLVSGITEPISDGRISNFCTSISKSISFLLSIILMVGFMIFVTVLLMIFSANAFI
jgi:stage III sporulation protein AE